MQTVIATLRHLDATASVAIAAKQFTAALRELWPQGAAEDAALRPTCSAVIFSRERREVWLLGDCACRFSGRTISNPKLVDTVLATARAEAVRYLLKHGHTVADLRQRDLGRAFIYDALREQTNFQNAPQRDNPFRYIVLDGSPIDLNMVKVCPVGSASRLVLASDGYPALFDTLAETEAHLATLLQADPLCCGALTATKCIAAGNVSFDDRTYLSLAI